MISHDLMTRFDDTIFSKLIFLNLTKNSYSLETRRSMFKFVTSVASVPGKETITQTTRTVIGTTTVGSASLATFVTGLKVEQGVTNNHLKVETICTSVKESPFATPEQKEQALGLFKQVGAHQTDWSKFHEPTPTVLKGVRYFVGHSSQTQKWNESHDLVKQALDLQFHEGMEKIKKTSQIEIPSVCEWDFFNFL